jgi:hypothetical protein
VSENHDFDPAQVLNEAGYRWRWRSFSTRSEPLPVRLRIGVLMFVMGGHLLAYWVFDSSSFTVKPPERERITTLVFLDPPPEPEPLPEPEPEPVPPPEPEPVPEPEPAPEPEPEPEPTPEPEPEPTPEPEPEPTPEPEPEPTPEPEPEPEPEPTPEPQPEPEPEPEPVPEPEPQPELPPAPEPEPEAEPAPEPQDVPEPELVILPVAEPEPERIDAPAARIEVDIAPVTKIAPRMAPVQVPVDLPTSAPQRLAAAPVQLTPEEKKKLKLKPGVVIGDLPQPELAPELEEPAEPLAGEPLPPAPVAATPPPGSMQAIELSPVGRPPGGSLQLYRADGSLDLPEDVVRGLSEPTGQDRQFSFQLPGLEESGTFMKRQPVLAYEETRFEQYWRPNRSVLTSLLEEAVKKTTGTIEIPIPGSPGSKLVCSVSVLAFGGGCGIRNNNDGYVVELDDPDTLNPEEDKQCQAWWDRIVGASSQEVWRNTRDLYEAQCRKPLAKSTEVPIK